MSDLYNRIYDLCQERNISVGKMCNELGISRGNLTELKMDRIKTLKADNLTKISGFFGVSIDYLLGTETKKAPTQEGEREIDDRQMKAAFLGGLANGLSDEEIDEYWDDARDYIGFKIQQKKNRSN